MGTRPSEKAPRSDACPLKPEAPASLAHFEVALFGPLPRTLARETYEVCFAGKCMGGEG
jgi:hypothetical protein